MFGFTIIKNSKLESMRDTEQRLRRHLEQADAKYAAELRYSMRKTQQCFDQKLTIDDLKFELDKYKQLYADELQKRLALADAVRESEIKTEE